MADVRLFLGFRVPLETAEGVLNQVRGGLEGYRVYEPEDLHLTLAFLGAWPEDRVGDLADVAQEELRGLPAPDLHLLGTGAFPDSTSAKALWVGVEEPDETFGRFSAVVERCRQAGRCLGWRPEGLGDRGPAKAHITVARSVGPPSQISQEFMSARPRGTWIAQDVALIESTPDCPQQRYTVRATWPLVVRPG
jgi:RNA 2',3'-cyclic 3'-phosphodiesterase